jgi:transcriptional antiterminator RfaH
MPQGGSADGTEFGWFCLRSQPKHEHIAARHLAQMDVEVLNPRIRFQRVTRHGPVLVTEAMFPNYLFARFDFKSELARVNYAPGVSCVVHFGQRWPKVPDDVIEQLRETLGQDLVHVVPTELASGDSVIVTGGPLHGLETVIAKVLPGKRRVMVLMEFLGRQRAVEVDSGRVVKLASNGVT